MWQAKLLLKHHILSACRESITSDDESAWIECVLYENMSSILSSSDDESANRSRESVSKETYYSVKRDLLQCQKRPTTVNRSRESAREPLPAVALILKSNSMWGLSFITYTRTLTFRNVYKSSRKGKGGSTDLSNYQLTKLTKTD